MYFLLTLYREECGMEHHSLLKKRSSTLGWTSLHAAGYTSRLLKEALVKFIKIASRAKGWWPPVRSEKERKKDWWPPQDFAHLKCGHQHMAWAIAVELIIKITCLSLRSDLYKEKSASSSAFCWFNGGRKRQKALIWALKNSPQNSSGPYLPEVSKEGPCRTCVPLFWGQQLTPGSGLVSKLKEKAALSNILAFCGEIH